MKYSDQQRINKIYEYASKLNQYIQDNHITKENLVNEFSLQWLVTTPLYNIGEHVYSLSKEYKEMHGDIQLTAGMQKEPSSSPCKALKT